MKKGLYKILVLKKGTCHASYIYTLKMEAVNSSETLIGT
jgi:hypothetical protein